MTVSQCIDSTERTLAENGNGTVILYSDDFRYTIGTGPIKDGLKDGAWNVTLNDTLRYEATYKSGNVIAGNSYAKSGNKYSFNKEYTAPEFMGGLNKFGSYLAKSIVYPLEARNHNIQGRAILTFIVDRQGILRDIHSVQGNQILAQEALRVMRLSPPWKPATSYGVTVDVICSVPISFSLAYEQH
ncbi:energy transducer TonB [Mucilaginibacter sp. NFR10]|uniref:energy transducer TonB n=1 Tax=Mucilaginibacter sp. NFR10 TaxID=1566292 RepID=UPI0008717882|nr:energy transducer TonB [Mucilaginibacter sp. NFR10]SCW48119.1 TonB family C-terminal domain-containing protein [Mucilaginibacter sp. NFR10]